ncbi:MAG: patatin-like phospholipase family protein [Treponema sp.]|jgi:NTE family protein|nr:patatin-like phospholipase family protein [Treponema sp.]
MQINKNLKWALVLSGGGAKGIAHIGVLKALAEMGAPQPSLIVGTSMGAIVGGLYATGMSIEELLHFTLERFDIAEYLDSFVFKMNGPVGKVLQTGQILGSFTTKRGIDSGRQLLKLFEGMTENKTFADTRIPFRCNAVDLLSGKEVVFDSGPLARAMRASMSFPVFFEPLIDDGCCFVDGGLIDNMPTHIAREAGFRRILAVDVYCFKGLPLSVLNTGSQIVYRSLEMAIHQMGQKSSKYATLTLYAGDDTSAFNFFRKKELIVVGERAVQDNKRRLTAFFSTGITAQLALRQMKNE